MATRKTTKKKSKAPSTSKALIIRDVIALSIIFFGIYMIYFLSSENAGTVGNGLRTIVSFLFGRGSYYLSSVLILSGFMVVFGKVESPKKRLLIAGILLMVFLVMLFALLDEQVAEKIFSRELFAFTFTPSMGGGLLGTFFATLSIRLFSLTGTIILLVLMALIVLVLITSKSIQEYLEGGKSRVKQDTKRIGEAMRTAKPPFADKSTGKTSRQEVKQLDTDDIKILDYAEIRPQIKKTDQEQQIKETDAKKPVDATDKKPIKMKPEELEKEKEAVEHLIEERKALEKPYQFPSLQLLDDLKRTGGQRNRSEVMARARLLEKTLSDFGVMAKVSEVSVGPTVTRYELQPEPGVKVSKIVNLSNDLALSLATSDVRIEAPIPGKAAIGIEVPNKETDLVHMREIVESPVFRNHKSKISFALGKKLSGSVVMADIAKMPHMLIAGATGSGKSVCINSILISILYKATPEEVKLILIDPKMVELNNYNGIPHLLIPVVTDPKHAAGALNWGIKEMTKRYQAFKDAGVRDITRFNELAKEKGEEAMPRIVIIIDELADLMMVSPREVENAICRLAQLARAAGIHLVLATQRPSVDVITGLIKANIPSRISFAVSSMMDSRTILDMGGAEKLLGRGDMLYYPSGEPKPVRIQGTFISDKEVERVVEFVKKDGQPDYSETIIEEIKENKNPIDDDFDDDMLPKAIEIAMENGTISTSQVQRKLRLGYSRAGRIIDEMEERGIISGPDGSKPRKVLVQRHELADSDDTEE
ncbi:DNA translocase FtsK 4TM domain-containing protein [Alkalibacter rhizosphaerae]|uniref:DNA translocase FtsK 4TM domain-containing protein n=1 Tax=Alkalibacter rhizosphaerae TaxID=2815577 RepID=A0A974XF04_9FIRM|nr:DNA translocase FtsK [Alkalibacter rhizosphaerae]QSX08608.1 DNA translocase FtsK 4TM domain-containing protein [Alkalibacter rhizosphaerae]